MSHPVSPDNTNVYPDTDIRTKDDRFNRPVSVPEFTPVKKSAPKTTRIPRVAPTAAQVQDAAKMAAVVEISGRLNASLYAVTQVELRRFKRLERLLATLSADHKMLEGKIQRAIETKAPIQDGILQPVIETTPARASTSWKDLYAGVVGPEVVAAKEAEAKITAKDKPGTPKLRVFAKEAK